MNTFWIKLSEKSVLPEKSSYSGFFLYTSLLSLLIFCLASCTSYYQRQIQFNRNFEQGNMKSAEASLLKDKKGEYRKTKLLHCLNLGTVTSLEGKYEESNNYFEKAYILSEDYQKNYLYETASFLVNPGIVEYKGEDFEILMIHYYKALNYLKMGQKQEALVECRRMNIRLNKLSDKYTAENKFQRDAFIHLLMGIIYDANGETNDAFIAYRNAAEIYESDYHKFFGLSVPEQLKKDLLRTAYLNGFMSDLEFWEQKFNMKYQPEKVNNGNVIFLWQNGLCPIKEQDAITFTIARGQAGFVNFSNPVFGFNFSFPLDDSTYHKSGLAALEFIRVAFPKYVERPVLFQSARLVADKNSFVLEKAEDINAIAFKTLQQRMLQELGKALLRLALKKASEYTLRKENQGLGAVLSMVNAITEHADTRGWQSLPHSIYYSRVSLPEGKNTVELITQSPSAESKTTGFSFDIKKGQTLFQTFSSLETKNFATSRY